MRSLLSFRKLGVALVKPCMLGVKFRSPHCDCEPVFRKLSLLRWPGQANPTSLASSAGKTIRVQTLWFASPTRYM